MIVMKFGGTSVKDREAVRRLVAMVRSAPGPRVPVVWALDHGARMVRVHEVRSASRAAALLDVLEGAAA
jgi:aspartokinase